MASKARLDPRWWKENRPDCLSKSAVEKPLTDLAKISRTLEKSGNVANYFKAVSSLKSAIAKDQQTAKKAKDKQAYELLSELEELAHEQTKEREGHLTLKGGLRVKGLSGASGQRVRARPGASVIDEIVNAGDKAWPILKDSKAVNSAKKKSCQAIPKGLRDKDLDQWKLEKTDWTCRLRNEKNEIAVELNFYLQYRWNGQTTKTSGLFLTDYRVWADATVPWGYQVDVEAAVDGQPFNSGSREVPVGAINLLISAKISTPLKSFTKDWSITCHGNKQREVK